MKISDATRAGPMDARAQKRAAAQNQPIYRAIYSAIFERKLLPGTKLKEDVLSEIYQVSRTRIREVLARLAHDKVVTRAANRVAVVARPTIAEAHEVFTARRLVEGHLVRVLANARDRDTCLVLGRQIERERKARAGGDFAEIIRESAAFHLMLADLADSPIIGGFLRELVSQASLISAVYERGLPANCELDEHRALIACIAEGRADDAVGLMTDHLDGIESRLDLSPPRSPQSDLRDVLGQEPQHRERARSAAG